MEKADNHRFSDVMTAGLVLIVAGLIVLVLIQSF